MLPGLTGYGWNGTRYYDLDDGQFVSMSTIRDALETVIDDSAIRMNVFTAQLQSGEISLADWQTNMMQEIKISHVASGAAANGGWGQMTSADWGTVGHDIRDQYDYLRNFAQEIADGTQPLDGRMLVRADLYGDAARGTFEDVRFRNMEEQGFEEEMRVLEAADGNNCDGCIEQAGHWEPLGTLDDIGDEECQVRCRCKKIYRRMNADGVWEESE